MTDLAFRPLQSEDVKRCAELHLQAFPDFFLSQLGPRFLREFYRGFLDDPDAVTVVAETAGGDVTGVVVGTLEPRGFFSRLLKRRFVGFAAATALAVLRRPSRLPRLVRGLVYRGQVPLDVGGALLSSICVDPRAQSRGTGTELITRFEAIVRSCEMGAYLVTDHVDNDSANAFYLRSGWKLAGEYDTTEGRRMNCYVLLAREDHHE
ncbi:GNAT family N-acetyltransferase [Cumulibacter manganitolerans]|uniref:GNAT family N-acetyltransferase n=1 Tax=Cumulibacter manganitolerans TaxID=1884992 RepID=UPI001885F06A|nr:GNAT family N-acetyltransferase [Cumulibacter manganitolerans]